MPVRLRLARHGQRNTPYFHIVAINSSKRRDARPLEKLGEYDPIPRLPSLESLPSSSKVFGEPVGALPKEKKVVWNEERIRYWLDVGAQPTRSVVKLLERGGVLQTPHKYQHAWSPPPGEIAQALASASKAVGGPRISTKPTSSSSNSPNPASPKGKPDTPPEPVRDPSGTTTGSAGATAS